MTAKLALGAWLVVVWVALWGDISVANVLSGAAVAAGLLVVFPLTGHPADRLHVRPLAVARLVLFFVVELFKSNLIITRTIVSRRDRVRTGVIAVPLTCDTDVLLTIVANLTALTPGMMAIEVEREPPRFFVHVLQVRDPESSRQDVWRLERLVINAFGRPELIEEFSRRHSEVEAA